MLYSRWRGHPYWILLISIWYLKNPVKAVAVAVNAVITSRISKIKKLSSFDVVNLAPVKGLCNVLGVGSRYIRENIVVELNISEYFYNK